MKRFFVLMLALALALSMAACADTPAPTPTAGNDTDTTATDPTAGANEIVFDKLSIYESDIFSILVTGIDAENPGGYTLNLTVANNMEPEEVINIEYVYETNEEGESEIVEEIEYVETIETTLCCVLESAKINGTNVNISFTSRVDSDTRNYDQLVFDSALVNTLGDFTEIELSFRVYDVSKPEETVATASGVIYPYGNNSTDATEAA